jgi:hypothetical protein
MCLSLGAHGAWSQGSEQGMEGGDQANNINQREAGDWTLS